MMEQIASAVVVAPDVTAAAPFAGQSICALPLNAVGL